MGILLLFTSLNHREPERNDNGLGIILNRVLERTALVTCNCVGIKYRNHNYLSDLYYLYSNTQILFILNDI